MTACVRETHDEKSRCYEERIRTALYRRSGKYWMHILLIIREILSICSVSRTIHPIYLKLGGCAAGGTSKWGVDLDEWYLDFDLRPSWSVLQRGTRILMFALPEPLALMTVKQILFVSVWTRKGRRGVSKMSPAQKLKVDMTKTDGCILFIFIFGFLWQMISVPQSCGNPQSSCWASTHSCVTRSSKVTITKMIIYKNMVFELCTNYLKAPKS